MSKKVSELDLEEKKKVMINFIFDEDKVQKLRNFTQCKYSEDTFGYGLLLPKEKAITNKMGEVIGKEQIWSPVIITNKGEIIESTKENQQKQKIKFETIPTNISLRWSLESIKSYLEGDESVPELTPKELFEKIESQYKKHIFEINPIWNKINSLWDIGGYTYEIFDCYPLSEKKGLQETAKTKRARVSKNLSFNATGIMVNPSEATLFRETHDKRPTKYFDEAEKLFAYNKGKLEPDNRVELINASYSKGSSVPRIEKVGNRFICVYYKCYSPTMLMSIRGLLGATESRAITQICTRNPDNDARGETEIDDGDSEWSMLRDYLYLFGLKHWKDIEKNYKNKSLYSDLKLKKRDLQLWRPLLSIAELIDHKLFLEIVDFAEELSSQRRGDFITEDSFDYKFLTVLKMFVEDSEIVRLKDVRRKYIDLYGSENVGREKSFSTRLDNLGFREYRKKDRDGVYFKISKALFDIIINTICPNLSFNSSHSSHSSQLPLNIENSVTNEVKDVTKVMNKKNKCDESTNRDENDECIGVGVLEKQDEK